MTELQKTFLFYSAIFLVIQGALYLGFHVFLIMLERNARIKHAQCKEYLQKKRASEQVRWKMAYELYDKKQREKENNLSKSE